MLTCVRLSSYKLHGSPRPISMKSDVIRKRARHDARRGSGNLSDTPSASPGASRRASPIDGFPHSSPILSQNMFADEPVYNPSSSSELIGALGDPHQQVSNHLGGEGAFSIYPSSSFPGPYHPDFIATQTSGMPSDGINFGGETSDYDAPDMRSPKRRRLSESVTEPPVSAMSYTSYDSFSSSSSNSQNSAMEFPFSSYGTYGLFRQQTLAYPHPPMNGGVMMHPPMAANEDSPMDFLQPPTMQQDEDSLFATYLHPPMVPPEEAAKLDFGSMHSHQSMSSQDVYDFQDSGMQSY